MNITLEQFIENTSGIDSDRGAFVIAYALMEVSASLDQVASALDNMYSTMGTGDNPTAEAIRLLSSEVSADIHNGARAIARSINPKA